MLHKICWWKAKVRPHSSNDPCVASTTRDETGNKKRRHSRYWWPGPNLNLPFATNNWSAIFDLFGFQFLMGWEKGHTCTPSSVIQLLLVITRVLDVQEPCGQCHLSWKTTFNALQKLDATITRTSKIEFTNQFLGLWVRGWVSGHIVMCRQTCLVSWKC